METLAISGIGKRNGLLEIAQPIAAENGLAILGMDAEEWPPARVAVDHFERLPAAREIEFIDQYMDALQKFSSVGHLTLVDPEIPVLGGAPKSRSMFLNPPISTSSLCEDKFAFHKFLDRLGIPTVPTFLKPPTSYPYIAKDRRGSAASGFHVFMNESDARGHDASSASESIVYQPFVAGAHLCVDALFSLSDGYLVDLCAKKVVAKRNGETFLVEAVDPGAVTELVRQLSRHVVLRGIVNLDVYQLTGPDDLVLMEVNCRIGGNYPASHLLGCDMLSILLSELRSGRAPAPYQNPRYEIGKRVGKYYGFTRPF